MKNIEKYPNTRDALKEYNALGLKNMPFDKWLELEFEEPREPTLLEAAEELKKAWPQKGSFLPDIAVAFSRLTDAIKREKRKPVRNCDKYNTVKDAMKAFSFMCDNTACEHCPYNQGGAFKCEFAWLYATAEKEEK